MRYTKYPIALAIYYISFLYYYFLSAKEWTWMFVSSDSGSWLASAHTWMVPQPIGSPLYIALGHLISLFSDNLVQDMTVWLSAAPAAITVALVYLIVLRLTSKNGIAILSAGVLFACGLFLSQATILEEYTLPTMFLTLAFWCYINGYRWWTVLALTAASAVHAIAILITVLWLIMQRGTYRAWLRPTLLLIGLTLASYGLIPLLMYLDTPRFAAGWLSWRGLIGYCTDTGGATIGTISLADTPMRLVAIGSVILLGYGLALVPMVVGARSTIKSLPTKMMLVVVGFTMWLSCTSNDPTTWTFLAFSAPFVAILAGVGLSRLQRGHMVAVGISVLVLLVANGFFLNANTLTKERPYAREYYEDMMELPYGAYVATPMGGAYGLGLVKAVVIDRPDLVPLFVGSPKADGTLAPKWAGYLDWLYQEKGVDVVASRYKDGLGNFDEIVRWAVADDKEVFWCRSAELPTWTEVWEVRERYNDTFDRIVVP